MTVFRLLAAFVLFLIAFPANAQTVAQAPSGSKIVASADSPSKVIHVDVTLNPEGRVGYIVSRQGKPVIAESRLGFLFTDAPEMLRNFVVAGQSTPGTRTGQELANLGRRGRHAGQHAGGPSRSAMTAP